MEIPSLLDYLTRKSQKTKEQEDLKAYEDLDTLTNVEIFEMNFLKLFTFEEGVEVINYIENCPLPLKVIIKHRWVYSDELKTKVQVAMLGTGVSFEDVQHLFDNPRLEREYFLITNKGHKELVGNYLAEADFVLNQITVEQFQNRIK